MWSTLQNCLLIRSDFIQGHTCLNVEWGWCECLNVHNEEKNFRQWPQIKENSKNAFYIKKIYISVRRKFCRKYKNRTVEDWGKVTFSDKSLFRLFGASGKSHVPCKKKEGEMLPSIFLDSYSETSEHHSLVRLLFISGNLRTNYSAKKYCSECQMVPKCP